jgi:ACT domain-containing protein
VTKESLIYGLTKVVFGRLGTNADVHLVEDLVTDIARFIENAEIDGPGIARPTGTQGTTRVVVSAFGTSRPGIVAAISTSLADSRYSIIDMNQTVVQGKFAMVLIAESGSGALPLPTLKERLTSAGEGLGVRVYAQTEDLFQAMHRV